MKNSLLLIVLFQLPFLLWGKDVNSWMYCPETSDSSKPGALYFTVDNLNFFKNNEYFHWDVPDQTLIGYLLQPGFTYYTRSNTKISAGIMLQKYSGINYFSGYFPVYSIRQTLSPSVDVIFGTLEGTYRHGLIEPLYFFDNALMNPTENGFQFLMHTHRFTSDMWLDWQQFIFRNDPYQEELVIGNTSSYRLIQKANGTRVDFLFQMLTNHHGGQINSDSLPVRTFYNVAPGFRLSFSSTNPLYREYGIKAYLCLFGSDMKYYQYQDGYGVMPVLYTLGDHINTELFFWKSEKYLTPFGYYLYQSYIVPVTDSPFYNRNRELIGFKAAYHKDFDKGITLGVRFDTFYNIQSSNAEFNYGFYLVFDEEFFMLRTR